MSIPVKKLKNALAVLLVCSIISCNNEKADEAPPSTGGETTPEQMPMKTLSPDSSSDMPVMATPDSTATMPNGYDSSKEPLHR